MELILVDSTNKDKGKEKANFNGIMDKYMKEIGYKEKDMGMVLGKIQQAIIIRDNGSKVDSKETELEKIKKVFIKENF